MSRLIPIPDEDLSVIVKAASYALAQGGTHEDLRALARAHLLLDTMIPDADDLLGWTTGLRPVQAFAAAERRLGATQTATVDYLHGAIAGQADQLGINPHHSGPGLGGLATLLVATDLARHQTAPVPASVVLSLTSMAAARFAPAEVRG